MWVSTPMGGIGGVARFDGTSWRTYLFEDDELTDSQLNVLRQTRDVQRSGLAGDFVSCIAVDGDGNIWFGSYGGLTRFDGHSWMTMTPENSGVPTGLIESLAFDQQGNLWVGTSSGGGACFDGQAWWTFPEISDTFVSVIFPDEGGNVWIATTYTVGYYVL